MMTDPARIRSSRKPQKNGRPGALPQGASPEGASPEGVSLQGVSPQGVSLQGVSPQGVSPDLHQGAQLGGSPLSQLRAPKLGESQRDGAPYPPRSSSYVELYDTTLRDGAQGVGISFTLEDKFRIARALDELGIDYIEAGWPGSNPLDTSFFNNPPQLKHAQLVAFGMTSKVGIPIEQDPTLQALMNSKTNAVAVVGKSSRFQVDEILRVQRDAYLNVVENSVAYLRNKGSKLVLFDAEHFFDGYLLDPDFSLTVLRKAHEGGAKWLVLCDTNGGTSPEKVAQIVGTVHAQHPTWNLSIHPHNDTEQAVSCALAAINAGARQVQGTINGIGERCGNANLTSIIANLALKTSWSTGVTSERLRRLRATSLTLSNILNVDENPYQAFVGRAAFSHKAGLHASGMARHLSAYEHVEPEKVGNKRQMPVSSQAGRATVLERLQTLRINVPSDAAFDKTVQTFLTDVKTREHEGYAYDMAQASLDLLLIQRFASMPRYFEIMRFAVTDSHVTQGESITIESKASMEVAIGARVLRAESEGVGPVSALDNTFRRIVNRSFPALESLKLTDYSVRILPTDTTHVGSNAVTRVLIRHALTTPHGLERFGTIGVSCNIIEASFLALADSYRYSLWMLNASSEAIPSPILADVFEVVAR